MFNWKVLCISPLHDELCIFSTTIVMQYCACSTSKKSNPLTFPICMPITYTMTHTLNKNNEASENNKCLETK